MIFVFDLDDTICDSDGYSEQYIKEFIKQNNLKYKQIAKDVRYAEMKFDWSHQQALTWYKTYGDEMMLNFPCKPKAVETINALHKQGHTIIIATARAEDWHSEPEKITLEWLDKVGLKYDKIYLGRVDKENICDTENADAFVDDDLKITSKVHELFKRKNKGVAFLTTTNFNKHFSLNDDILRIDSLDEMVKTLNLQIAENNMERR